MRELDGMRIIGPDDGASTENPTSVSRELVTAADTGERWRLGEVTARPDESVATHVHPGEPETLITLEGDVELHGSHGIAQLGPGDVVFIPPETEHGLRTPQGGGSPSGPTESACPAAGTPTDLPHWTSIVR